MFQQKKNLIGLWLVLVGLSVSAPVLSEEIANNTSLNKVVQSDSEEVSPQDILKIDEASEKVLKDKNADLQSAVSREKETAPFAVKDDKAESEEFATITAEGDFVVPTFMLQTVDNPAPGIDKDSLGGVVTPQFLVPQKPKNTQSPAVRQPQEEQLPSVQKTEEEVYTKTVRELPVIKITQTELVPVREQMAVERRLTGKTTKTTRLYNEALARSQVKLPDNATIENNQTGRLSETKDSHVSEKQDVLKKKKLLLPLKELPKPKPKEEDLSGTEPLYTTYGSEMADKVLSETSAGNESLLMPQDIKVTFYPYSTEFSGQAIKWIKVFSMRARNDPRYAIEVRLSQVQPQVQQKRLYMIKRILMNNGLSMHQIMVDYVNRPADSLILRMVKKQEDIQTRKTVLENGQIKENKTINW